MRFEKGMPNMDNQNKETAIRSEQQFDTTQRIIDNIIKIFSDNILSISDAEYILHETSKKLHKQPVIIIDDQIKHIYKMRNMGEIK